MTPPPRPGAPRLLTGDPRHIWIERLLAALCFSISLAACAYLAARGSPVLSAIPDFPLFVGLLGLAATAAASILYHRMASSHVELQGARAKLGRQTRTDPLTGLLNRAAFLECFETARREGLGPVGVLFVDLDKFKDVNDTLGHRAGDQVLIQVARRCEAVIGEGSYLARLGGDEFAMLVPIDGRRSPEEIGQAVVEAANEPMMIDGKLVSIGASVGVTSGNLELDSNEDLLRRADLAMYDAKGSQHGACRVFDDALSSRQFLESAIRIALGKPVLIDELAMAYQPVIEARTGRLDYAEALLRWRSQEMGDVAPSTLIPIAEASGHIETLTEWTLDQVFETIGHLGGAGVAVNISPLYFKHPEFVHRIFDRLLAGHVKPEKLTLEITESSLISSIERAEHAIARLRDVGVRIFLDDFGTGYSSLSYLQHFELDGLKLDKSFLRNVGTKRQATQIIRTMVNFGHSLDMKVVVEGVENEWQVRLLQLIGCDLLQGFEIGVPMTIEDIVNFKAKEKSLAAGDPQFDTDTQIDRHLRRLLA
jgi:diguanylate cyclase (GGDEF)-like protein